MITGIRFEIHRVIEPKTFGEFIRVAREMQGLTHAQLAELSGVKRTTVLMVERGKDSRMSTINKLIDALGYEYSVTEKKEFDQV